MKLLGTATPMAVAALAALALVGWSGHGRAQTVVAPAPGPAPTANPGAPAGEPAQPSASTPVATPSAPPPATPPASAAPAAPAPSAPVPLAPPPPAAPHTTLAPGHALVHVAVNYPGAWLETRKYVDAGEFVRTCLTPCDTALDVQGLEARVVAPGMTTSNAFRFDSGTGTAGVRVEGGSATARTVGIMTLAIGIPVALAGMAMFGLGKTRDDTALKIGGIAGLAAGGLSIGVSFPLLLIGTTRVKSANGDRIATEFALSPSLN